MQDPKLTMDDLASRIDAQSQAAYERLVGLIRDGIDPRSAALNVLLSFGQQWTASLRLALDDILRLGGRLTMTDLLALPIGDISLSDVLFRQSAQVSREVAVLVQDHTAGLQSARTLALRLYDGYSPADGLRRPLEGRARAELPRALRAMTMDPAARASLGKLLERGQRDAARLRTPALRAAYNEAITTWQRGAGQAALQRRLDVAMREKIRFQAQRIAVTELARANAAQSARELMDDESIDVVEIRINPAHPRADICDLHARADLWGLGPGLYPKAKAPLPPYHPFCWCRARSRPDKSAAGARLRPGGAAQYLRSMPPEQAARVMGSEVNAQRMQSGASVDSVVNAGRNEAYHLRRIGDLEAQQHPLIDRATEPAA